MVAVAGVQTRHSRRSLRASLMVVRRVRRPSVLRRPPVPSRRAMVARAVALQTTVGGTRVVGPRMSLLSMTAAARGGATTQSHGVGDVVDGAGERAWVTVREVAAGRCSTQLLVEVVAIEVAVAAVGIVVGVAIAVAVVTVATVVVVAAAAKSTSLQPTTTKQCTEVAVAAVEASLSPLSLTVASMWVV